MALDPQGLNQRSDNVIFERLASGNDELKKVSREHLEQYGEAGLRTLCLAYKDLSPDMYETWNEKFIQSKSGLRYRERKLDEVTIFKNGKKEGVTVIKGEASPKLPPQNIRPPLVPNLGFLSSPESSGRNVVVGGGDEQQSIDGYQFMIANRSFPIGDWRNNNDSRNTVGYDFSGSGGLVRTTQDNKVSSSKRPILDLEEEMGALMDSLTVNGRIISDAMLPPDPSCCCYVAELGASVT
ncbi:hypothetical protein Lser_V15G14360 [Lactuca serriola]